MSYFSQNIDIVSIDYIEKLNDNENTENINHAIPINNENREISIFPLVIIPDNRPIQYKHKIISTSIILFCFSIIIIIIAIHTLINNKKHNSLSTTPISNSSSNYLYIKF
jgi:hypothetical protein